MRARMALITSRQQCILREIVLKHKPQQMLALSGKGTVPVLWLENGDILDESLDIMIWALTVNDPEGWLVPETGTIEDIINLVAENDGPFKNHLDRYKYSNRYDDGTRFVDHRDKAQPFLRTLDNRLERYGYLFGARPGLADYAIFPFIRQFANTDNDWFDQQPLSALQNWLTEHVQSDLFQKTMHKWPLWNADGHNPEHLLLDD